MTLHLVHAPVDMNAFHRWSRERGLVRDKSFDAGYALHILLSGMFGKAVLQPFRLFASDRRRGAGLYAYADADREALSSIAAAPAPPDSLAVLDPTSLRAKPMPARFRAEQRLGFDVRVRPVRRSQWDVTVLPAGTGLSRGSEVDAFLRRARDGRSTGENAASREQVYAEWLGERCGAAVRIGPCRLAAFRLDRAVRGDGLGPKGPDATLHGVLTVRDPAAFARLVRRGIGRHTAYGYGMLLLRPPGRT